MRVYMIRRSNVGIIGWENHIADGASKHWWRFENVRVACALWFACIGEIRIARGGVVLFSIVGPSKQHGFSEGLRIGCAETSISWGLIQRWRRQEDFILIRIFARCSCLSNCCLLWLRGCGLFSSSWGLLCGAFGCSCCLTCGTFGSLWR